MAFPSALSQSHYLPFVEPIQVLAGTAVICAHALPLNPQAAQLTYYVYSPCPEYSVEPASTWELKGFSNETQNPFKPFQDHSVNTRLEFDP